MRKLLVILLALVMVLGLALPMAAPALAAATVNAALDSSLGALNPQGGTAAEAVATPDDGKFIQLDVDAWVIMKFPGDYIAVPDGTAAADLRIDTLDILYPAEAEILVSLDGTNWTSMGVQVDTADIDINLEGVGAVKYVKIDQAKHYIDPAYPGLGFDLNAVVALNPSVNEYTLTVNKIGNGTVNADVAGPYHWGDVVTLSAVADAGWTFSGFSPSGSVTMNGNQTVTATFTQNEYTLTVNKVGNGTVDAVPAGPYHWGDTVILSAVADAGWTFSGFSPSGSVTMNGNQTVTATFTQNEYTLTVNKVGNGTVNAVPAGAYHWGDMVTLSAVADAGWTFSGFSPIGSVTMNGNQTVTATFTQNVYTLTVNVTPAGGGTVAASIPGPYHYGDVVTLTPTAAAGYTFGSFSPISPVTIAGNTMVTATFTKNQTCDDKKPGDNDKDKDKNKDDKNNKPGENEDKDKKPGDNKDNNKPGDKKDDKGNKQGDNKDNKPGDNKDNNKPGDNKDNKPGDNKDNNQGNNNNNKPGDNKDKR